MRRAGVLGGLLLAASALVACSDGPIRGCRPLALGDQQIESGFDVFVIDRSGGTRRFSAEENLYDPSVSPDGTAVAAAIAEGDVDTSDALATAVLVLDAEGRVTHRVPGEREAGDHAPAIAPDGERVAFVRSSDGEGDDRLLVVDVDDEAEDPVVLHDGPGDRLLGTSWSPDGRYIAVGRSTHGEDWTGELLVFDADTGELVLEAPWHNTSTTWSPDSTAVLGSDGGALREVQIADGTATDIPSPAGVAWIGAVYAGSGPGIIVLVADRNALTPRLDVVDRSGVVLTSTPLQAGLGVDRNAHPVTLGSISTSRCFDLAG
jgi:dipeptidyl aminopeptidase/acylaminoacyl peptidase